MRSTAALLFLLLLVSSASAQSRYSDRRRHFSFEPPAGWTQVSEEELEEDYVEPNEGIEGKPTTLAVWEKNPARSATAPILFLRWRKMRHTEHRSFVCFVRSPKKAFAAWCYAENVSCTVAYTTPSRRSLTFAASCT